MAVYGSYKTAGFQDLGANIWGLEILRKDYAGAAQAVESVSVPPMTFDFGDSVNFPHAEPIYDARVKFSLVSNSTLEFSPLFDHDPKKHQVKVRVNGAVFFVGLLVGDTYDEPFKRPPFFVQFAAHDGLKLLENRKWTNTGTYSELSIIRQCLRETGLELNINIAISTTLYDPAGTTPPSYEVVTKPCSDYVEKEYSYYDVLKDILLSYGAVLKQAGGEWQLIQYNEQAKKSYTVRKYDYTGSFISSATKSPVINHSGTGIGGTMNILSSSRLKITPAFKNFTIKQLLTAGESFVKNYDFDQAISAGITGILYGAKYWDNTTEVRIERSARQVGVSFAWLQGGIADSKPGSGTKYMHQLIGNLGSFGRAPGTDYYTLKFSMLYGLMNQSGAQFSGDVYIKMRVGNLYLTVTEEGYGIFTQGENYVKIANVNGNSINAPLLDAYELEIRVHPNTTGALEIWLYEPVNCAGVFGEFSSGAIYDKILLTADQDAQSEQVIETEINSVSNYEPEAVEIYAADVSDTPFGDTAYNNYLRLADGTPTQLWRYTTFSGLEVTESKLKVLAAQIDQLFKTNRLYMQANITSDILRFDSLVADPARLGGRVFAINRAVFEPKRLAWSGVECLELNGEDIADFDSGDFDSDDFDT